MPTCYAHKKMGALVYHMLSEDTGALVKKYLPYYLIGLHGPDILFHQPALRDAHVAKFGRELHHQSIEGFYKNARMVLQNSEDDRQLVYYYGFLTHLFLDHRIHAVIPALMKELGVSHAKLEAELDRYLMKQDGHDPVTYPVSAHIAIDPEIAHHIAPFYLGVSEGQILECIGMMKVMFSASRSRYKWYRRAASEVMAFAGFAEKIPNMIMTPDESECCLEVMPHLRGLLQEAAEDAAQAIEEAAKYIFSDEKMPNYIAYRLDGQIES